MPKRQHAVVEGRIHRPAPVDYNSSQVKLVLIALLTSALSGIGYGQAPADPAQDLLQKAVAAHQSGDMKTAIRYYREFLKLHPDVAEIRSNLGAALAHDGQFSEAIAEYREALKKLGTNPGVHMNLGLSYYKLGRLPEAAAEMELVRKWQPDSLQAALLLGDCWLQMGETKKVIDLLTPFEKKYPNDHAIIYMLGTSLLKEKQTGPAQVLLDRILGQGESAESALMLGFSQYSAHDNKAAVVSLARAIQLNPQMPGVHQLYALALKEVGDGDQAAVQFREELKINPFDFVSNIEIALLLKQDSKFDEALAHLDAAMRVRPGDAGALYQRATVHVLQGHSDEARIELEKLTKEYPSFTEAHVSLATVYYRLKRKEDGDRERAIVRRLQEEDQKRQEEKQKNVPAAPDASKQ
jgi:tetratricopeptide (TPR) repeat protein